jgi:hypothetical protein
MRTYSWSRKIEYSSSPTLTEVPPNYPTPSAHSPQSTPLSLPTTYRRNQDAVTRLHRGRDTLSLLVESAGSDSQHLGLVQLLDGALGQEDAGGGLWLRLEALHQDAVEQGRESLDVADYRGL